jgi:hypothetical protein
MNYLSFNSIHDQILNKYLPLADSIYELLHPDSNRAHHIFVEYLNDAVRDLYNHYPYVGTLKFPNGLSGSTYTFVDNFDAYIAGNIKEEDIELVPEAIARITTGIYNRVTKNNWRYEKPTLFMIGGATEVIYYAFPPIRWSLSPDGDFTEDSRVYGLDPNDDDIFTELVALNLLQFLQMTRDSVAQPTGLQFFNYREIIQKLQEDVNTYFAVSDRLYRMY